MLPVAQFNSFITANHLFSTQNKILAAVSGGMDSVFMVHLLHAAGYNIGIAHCNFKLRGSEANSDEQFCRELAHKLGVSFYSTSFDTAFYATEKKLSVQMAARDLRYTWFEEARKQNGYDVIAIAHHQNDTVETMLLNLTRGTGIAGLHGIKQKNGYLVRPLLFLTRDEIAAAVIANKITYREDSSNSSIKYSRNKIRHQVIPALKELNPQLENTFITEANYFAQLEQLLQQNLEQLKKQIIVNRRKETLIEIAKVKALKPLQLLLQELLASYGFTATTVADIISSLDKHAGRVFESADYQLVLDREHLIITPQKRISITAIELSQDQKSAVFGNYTISISSDTSIKIPFNNSSAAALDTEKLVYPLSMRNWKKGDSFYSLGMKTRKKLSDFFISLKIPLSLKSEIPLLVNGNGDILWICGYRISDRYKITPATKKISIFELTETVDDRQA